MENLWASGLLSTSVFLGTIICSDFLKDQLAGVNFRNYTSEKYDKNGRFILSLFVEERATNSAPYLEPQQMKFCVIHSLAGGGGEPEGEIFSGTEKTALVFCWQEDSRKK